MAYADYVFYVSDYKGIAITSDDFDRLITRASAYIDNITGGTASLYEDDDAVRMAACSVAEAWQKNEKGGEVQSESVGSWTRTYAKANTTNDKKLYDAAKIYLSRTGLLSRWT
jgi:hypothetical protein